MMANAPLSYTILVRLPFSRGDDFVDPPQIEWDEQKDSELWEILSTAKGQDLNWLEIAETFDVDLSFLTQQAAWLYERQLSQVRAQLRKANQPSPVNASPASGSASGTPVPIGGQPMSRGGSAGSRATSALSHRARERTLSHEEAVATDRRPLRASALSRKSSTNTVARVSTLALPQQSPPEGQSHQRYRRSSRESSKRSVESSPKLGKPLMERIPDSSAIESSSSESDRETPTSRSRTFARRPRYAAAKSRLDALSDADEEDDPASFLPFSTKETPITQTTEAARDPRESTRGNTTGLERAHVSKTPAAPNHALHSSSSSNVSQAKHQQRSPLSRPSTLSPKHRRMMKEAGSDGAVSMGSSFSDLDDASVTRSALEDAMAAQVQAGGMASRMSSISQALKSKYLQ